MELQDLLTPVLQTLISVVVPLLVAYLTVLVNKQIQKVKIQMSSDQLDFINKVVDQFVTAAEQYEISGQFKEFAVDKKEWVIEQAQAYLDQKGIHVEFGMLADTIEKAVYDGINWDKRSEERYIETQAKVKALAETEPTE